MAHPIPQSYPEFLQQIAQVTGEGGTVEIDEDLYYDLFGDGEGLGLSRSKGASEEFINSLSRVTETQIKHLISSEAQCPICLHTLASILTEEEYAQSSETFFGPIEDLGLRRLPCNPSPPSHIPNPEGHIICGKCARSWLRLNNTCPLCRAKLDPSVPHPNSEDFARGPDGQPLPNTLEDPVDPEDSDRLLRLFRILFGEGNGQSGAAPGRAAREPEYEARDEFVGMYS